MKKTFLFLLGCLLVSGVYAQKFGYCNSGALLTQIPEVKAADSDLTAFQTQLTKRGQEMVEALQKKAQDLERKQQQGTISPKDLEIQSAKLKEEEAAIAKYEQEVYEKLSVKREELFKPILDRVNQAMADVAKENQFMFVFDSGSQVLLYSDESLDVTKLVKAKLGIPN
ncbi:MAG TPA: OmpH family outer membrane protein [Saprospiraceae bacterium]|nr:OmpH family outer membrane protein [Saprospiraceae bacterium]